MIVPGPWWQWLHPISVCLLKTRGVLLLLEPVFLNLVPYQALALILVEKLIVWNQAVDENSVFLLLVQERWRSTTTPCTWRSNIVARWWAAPWSSAHCAAVTGTVPIRTPDCTRAPSGTHTPRETQENRHRTEGHEPFCVPVWSDMQAGGPSLLSPLGATLPALWFRSPVPCWPDTESRILYSGSKP